MEKDPIEKTAYQQETEPSMQAKNLQKKLLELKKLLNEKTTHPFENQYG